MNNSQYGKFLAEHLEKMREGILLFNQQKYWECHEELEHHWLEDRGDNARNVYWAVIQVAAAMIHFRDKNLAGAQGLLKKAKDKFKRCENQHVETELLYDNLSWQQLKEMVFSVADDAELDEFAALFDFRFKDPKSWRF